jgi:hypothetical protein
LRFTQDERVRITTPTANASVRLPFPVSWTARDFAVVDPKIGANNANRPTAPDTGYFAVFVDADPMAPGRGFESLLAPNAACTPAVRACLTTEKLHDLGVYVTAGHSVTVDTLSATKAVGGGHSGVHAVTIVLVDARGRRIGDSNWYSSFTVQDR